MVGHESSEDQIMQIETPIRADLVERRDIAIKEFQPGPLEINPF